MTLAGGLALPKGPFPRIADASTWALEWEEAEFVCNIWVKPQTLKRVISNTLRRVAGSPWCSTAPERSFGHVPGPTMAAMTLSQAVTGCPAMRRSLNTLPQIMYVFRPEVRIALMLA